MFRLFRKESGNIFSPTNGKSILLENVPDKVFSTKMMGDGVAFEFNSQNIYAPCDGMVIMVARTKHAIGFKTKDGIELLLHVGLDTVNLGGDGLYVHVTENQKVRHGQKIMTIDLELMKEKNINLITPLIVTSDGGMNIQIIEPQNVEVGTLVIETVQT